MMKYSKAILVIGIVSLATSAAAQLDPGMKSWSMNLMADQSQSGTSFSSFAFSEQALPDVVVEHWVVRDAQEEGVRFGEGRLVPGRGSYASANEFLRKMWWQSVELDEQWFYARQTVLYQPLEKLASKDWAYDHPPIACMRLVDVTGRVVGHQVRTEAWSLYTDHWVLYPEYWPLARRGMVEFTDAAEGGCEWPGDLIERELAGARRRRDLAAFQYATSTYALLPLKPSHSSLW